MRHGHIHKCGTKTSRERGSISQRTISILWQSLSFNLVLIRSESTCIIPDGYTYKLLTEWAF